MAYLFADRFIYFLLLELQSPELSVTKYCMFCWLIPVEISYTVKPGIASDLTLKKFLMGAYPFLPPSLLTKVLALFTECNTFCDWGRGSCHLSTFPPFRKNVTFCETNERTFDNIGVGRGTHQVLLQCTSMLEVKQLTPADLEGQQYKGNWASLKWWFLQEPSACRVWDILHYR